MAVDWDTLVIGPTVNYYGEPVIYRGQSGPLSITGVFDEAYIEMTPLGPTGDATTHYDSSVTFAYPGAVTTEHPVLGVQLSQFPPASQPTQADTLQVRGFWYMVKEVRLDGHGHAKLLLNQIPAS